jgi:hypothetical protein
MLQLQIELKSVDKRRQNLTRLSSEESNNNPAQVLGPFGFPIDEEVMWGPVDTEISNYLNIIGTILQGLASLLEPELHISNVSVSKDELSDTKYLIQMALGLGNEAWFQPEKLDPLTQRPKRRQVLRAILAAAVNAWIFSAPGTQVDSYDSILLFHYQQEIFSKRK